MRGRTLASLNASPLLDCSTYVQINIYDTNIKTLREMGVDIEHVLKHTGFRSLVMDVPLLSQKACEFSSTEKQHHMNSLRYFGERNPSSAAVSTAVDDDTFQDCIQEPEKIAVHHKVAGSEVPSNAASSIREFSRVDTMSLLPFSEYNVGESQLNSITRMEPDRSFIISSGHAPKVPCNVPVNPLMSTEAMLSECDDKRKDGIFDDILSIKSSNEYQTSGIVAESDAPYTLTDLTLSTNTDIIKTAERIPNERENDTSPNGQLDDDVIFQDCIQRSDEDDVTDTGAPMTQQRRKRARRSSGTFQNSHRNLQNSMEEFCLVKISWRPRYGKNRLVDHVRLHWGKKVKKCNLCDYAAPHWRKVQLHHKRFHSDVKFTGVRSLETREDMEELMALWKQCFPDGRLGTSEALKDHRRISSCQCIKARRTHPNKFVPKATVRSADEREHAWTCQLVVPNLLADADSTWRSELVSVDEHRQSFNVRTSGQDDADTFDHQQREDNT
ncbi:hypothetical protein NECAME_07716 [Necator americanus]|uniref:C2H2-type domain-containing protein n=1 Tax=Necator americanus TaxID=51031 RepID=W2TPG9_NECAM|nr:hypothetical protein NECAME_07716 [Necator americanus]ETN82882.1 hypothetical protein NECAME_07716 [Necator americanus]